MGQFAVIAKERVESLCRFASLFGGRPTQTTCARRFELNKLLFQTVVVHQFVVDLDVVGLKALTGALLWRTAPILIRCFLFIEAFFCMFWVLQQKLGEQCREWQQGSPKRLLKRVWNVVWNTRVTHCCYAICLAQILQFLFFWKCHFLLAFHLSWLVNEFRPPVHKVHTVWFRKLWVHVLFVNSSE